MNGQPRGCPFIRLPMTRYVCALFLALLVPPAFAAFGQSHLSADPQVNHARKLIHNGRLHAALEILRSLADPARADITDIRFLTGLAAVRLAEQRNTDDEHTALLREAITAFHDILIHRPGLIRVRLELARAFFLKGEDALSRRHFERVLAGKPLPVIAANVNRFLQTIRNRHRWRGYLGAALAPDTNINGTSDAEFIFINGLPFRRSEASRASSGIGVMAWGGGEYAYPLSDRWRLRTGLDFHHTEYERTSNDRLFLASHVGPRLLYNPRTAFSLLGVLRRFWLAGHPYIDTVGGRLEANHRLTQRLSLNGSGEYTRRTFPTVRSRDGTSLMLQLGAAYLVGPTIQVTLGGGYEAQDARSTIWKNERRWIRAGVSVVLPWGLTAGATSEVHWTDFRGNWFPFTDGDARHDRRQLYRGTLLSRAVTLYGFSPQVVLTHEIIDSNAQLYSYDRNRAELRFVRQF